MSTPAFQSIRIDDELPSLVKPPLTEIQLVRCSGASGDFNPIHSVHQAGVDSGNEGVIAHGMVLMGFCGELITSWCVPNRSRDLAYVLPASADQAMRSLCEVK